MDVRYANTGNIGGMPITFGITANNNPSVQDPWNTTPAWSFPLCGVERSAQAGAGTLIDGTFAAHVGGVGAYAWINNLVYLELSGYRTIDPKTQAKLGADPFGAPDCSMAWRRIGAWPWNRIGAITGLSLAPSACPRGSIHGRSRRMRMAFTNLKRFLKPIDTPISASTRSINTKGAIIGLRCVALISTRTKHLMRLSTTVVRPIRQIR